MKIIYPVQLSLLLRAGAANLSPGCSFPQEPDNWLADVEFDGTNYTHAYSYPINASADNPAPLILFFHGWGGNYSECGSGDSCDAAANRGYATISLTGIGGEEGDNNSWNGFGSTESGTGVASEEALVAGDRYCQDARENDRICDVGGQDIPCYGDCNNTCSDNCWWTTCKDSVQQTVEVLEDFLDNYCVDMNRIYALGWSNGGMFTYELASDERTAKYLAAISPQVGLPHFGYNRGPHPDYKIHHFGLWGVSDDTCPPIESPSQQGCTVPCRSAEPYKGGYFFTSSACTMEKWAFDMGLTSDESVVLRYGIPNHDGLLECSGYSSNSSEDSPVVAGCIFEGGHYVIYDYMDEVALNFFDAHPKVNSTRSAQLSDVAIL